MTFPLGERPSRRHLPTQHDSLTGRCLQLLRGRPESEAEAVRRIELFHVDSADKCLIAPWWGGRRQNVQHQPQPTVETVNRKYGFPTSFNLLPNFQGSSVRWGVGLHALVLCGGVTDFSLFKSVR